MTEYNKPPVINPIPTAILAILSGIILVEAFLFFGFGDPLGNSGAAAKRMFLIQQYGVSPNLVNWMLERGNFSTDYIFKFISYYKYL